MAVTKLGIYNNALHLLGERRISNLYEDREPRHVLDQNYNLSLVTHCIQMTQPRFAVRSAKLATPVVSTVHGVDEVYSFPADFVDVLRDPGTHGSIGSFFADEDFTQPINRYIIEGNTVACEIATNIYMRYISSAPQPNEFSPIFGRLVSTYLARECASRINPSRIEMLNEHYDKLLQEVIAIESVKENQFITQKASASLTTDQLAIYNLVAPALGQMEFRGIDDDSAFRLAIDSVYALAEQSCLDSIRPKFSTRVFKMTGGATSSVHGLDNVTALPADFVTLTDVWAEEDLLNPVERYFIEDTDLVVEGYADVWIRYVSTASAEANWSPKFAIAVASYVAKELAPRFAPEEKQRLDTEYTNRIQEAVLSEGSKERHFGQNVPATLTADQIIIYNAAAALVGVPEIRFGDDESEFRHAVDAVYDLAERTALVLVKPKFATLVVEVSGGAPSGVHAVDNVTALPADFLTITDLWGDDELSEPIERYFIEAQNIVIDSYATSYMRYIAKDTAESTWSPGFSTVVAAYIAKEIAPRFAPEQLERLSTEVDGKLANVIATEAEKEGRFPQVSVSLSATALQVYNIAASALAIPELRYTEDESELRHALDSIYTTSTDYLLEAIKPRFATIVEALASPAASSEHGFDNVFTLPALYKQFVGVWSDELLDEPVERYFLEAGTIAVQSHTTIYLRYISTAAAETLWTPSFVQALGLYLASQVGPRFAPEESSRANKRFEAALQTSMIADATKESARPLAGTRTLTTVYRTLYNTALDLANLPPIISNDDESQRKVALDYALDHGAVETVLELISWGFARNSVKLELDDTVVPAWGHQYAFAVPTNMLRINSISADEYFTHSIPYVREEDYFYTDVSPLYLQYVSDSHVTTLSAWPRYFYNLVAAELAKRLGTVPNADMTKAVAKYQEYKSEAYSTDAQRNPPQVIASGSWTDSRFRYPTRRNSRRP